MIKTDATLKIELRSALCVGSGFSYAGIVDQDITYDSDGFPYIPARRLKGCLREAAGLVCLKAMEEMIFGKRGDGKPGRIQIGNGILKKAETLHRELELWQDNELGEYFAPQSVLECYTSVRAQTQLDEETGAAKENSLRFTRVVNPADPFELGTNLCFYAPVSYTADSEQEAEEIWRILEKTAKATRNIGMNRNRGLGSVRCELQGKEARLAENTDLLILAEPQPEGQVKLSFRLKNISPLILSEQDKGNTASYISGKRILGVLAGTYLARKRREGEENPAETKEFEDLFLNGTVKYANANLMIEGRRSSRAPFYLNRLKKTGKYVNLLDGAKDQKAIATSDSEYDMQMGNQPKKLKTQYALLEERHGKIACSTAEAEKEIVFHHRRSHGDEEPEALLYDLEVLSAGQEFIGEIFCPQEYQKQIRDLMLHADFCFGKSRSAQYGKCRLLPYPEKASAERRRFLKGDSIVVTLKSDAMFVNESGSYTVKFEEVKELLARDLNMSYRKDAEDHRSMVETTEISGYHTLWNMKRAAVPAIAAGSAFVYELETDLSVWPDFVGERNQEGFGEITVDLLKTMQFRVEEIRTDNIVKSSILSEDMKMLLYRGIKKKALECMIREELDSQKKLSLNASNIGRITLMLKESLNQANWNGGSPDDAAGEFWARIQSIKRKSVREAAERIAEKTLSPSAPGSDRYGIDAEKLYRRLQKEEALCCGLKELSKERKEELLKGIWGEYMQQLLTLLKYNKKGEGTL